MFFVFSVRNVVKQPPHCSEELARIVLFLQAKAERETLFEKLRRPTLTEISTLMFDLHLAVVVFQYLVLKGFRKWIRQIASEYIERVSLSLTLCGPLTKNIILISSIYGKNILVCAMIKSKFSL